MQPPQEIVNIIPWVSPLPPSFFFVLQVHSDGKAMNIVKMLPYKPCAIRTPDLSLSPLSLAVPVSHLVLSWLLCSLLSKSAIFNIIQHLQHNESIMNKILTQLIVLLLSSVAPEEKMDMRTNQAPPLRVSIPQPPPLPPASSQATRKKNKQHMLQMATKTIEFFNSDIPDPPALSFTNKLPYLNHLWDESLELPMEYVLSLCGHGILIVYWTDIFKYGEEKK